MIYKNTRNFIYFFMCAVLINIAVFSAIPGLSGSSVQHFDRQFFNPIMLAKYEPLPEKQPVRKLKKQPVVEKQVKPVHKPIVKQKQIKPKNLKVNINIPNVRFEINPMLKTDLSITAPLPEPVVAQAEPVELPVVASAPAIPSEFDLGDVDQAPRIIQKIEPVYPYRARRRNIQGNVAVKFLVSAKGSVQKPSIISATPKGVFEKNALQAIRKWKFQPGIWNGKPVATWVVVPIQFNLNG